MLLHRCCLFLFLFTYSPIYFYIFYQVHLISTFLQSTYGFNIFRKHTTCDTHTKEFSRSFSTCILSYSRQTEKQNFKVFYSFFYNFSFPMSIINPAVAAVEIAPHTTAYIPYVFWRISLNLYASLRPYSLKYPRMVSRL